MPWRGHYRNTCRVCGRARGEGEAFSARGKCYACGIGEAQAEVSQLAAHSGPHFERWRRAVAASVGAVILDERPERG